MAPYPPVRTAAAATYVPRPPYTAPVRPTSPLMRAGQVLAVLFCLAGGFLGADWDAIIPKGGGVEEARAGGEAMGYAMGLAISPLLFSALFLAWSRKTRRYIPFLGVAFMFMSAAGRAGESREEVDRELSQTRGIANAFMDSAGPNVGDGSSSAPPESQAAKLVWAMNRALTEAPEYMREVGGRHGIDPDSLPAAWGTSRYMAGATSHPEVERYWQGYQAYLADFREGFVDWLKSRAEAHAREAGVRSGALRAYVAGMNRSDVDVAQMESLAWADSTASAALAFHRFLVSVDARVSYDAEQNMAMFDREADLERANALQRRVENAVEKLNRARQAERRRGMQKLDSLAVHLK